MDGEQRCEEEEEDGGAVALPLLQVDGEDRIGWFFFSEIISSY